MKPLLELLLCIDQSTNFYYLRYPVHKLNSKNMAKKSINIFKKIWNYSQFLFHDIRLDTAGSEGTLVTGVTFTPGCVAAVFSWLCLWALQYSLSIWSLLSSQRRWLYVEKSGKCFHQYHFCLYTLKICTFDRFNFGLKLLSRHFKRSRWDWNKMKGLSMPASCISFSSHMTWMWHLRLSLCQIHDNVLLFGCVGGVFGCMFSRRQVEWEAASSLIEGICLTLQRQPIISFLPHLRSLINVCVNLVRKHTRRHKSFCYQSCCILSIFKHLLVCVVR